MREESSGQEVQPVAGHSLAGRGYQGGRQRSTGPWQEGELVSGTIVYSGHTEGAPPMRVGGRSRTGASTKCGNSWLSEALTGTWAVQFVFEPISLSSNPLDPGACY